MLWLPAHRHMWRRRGYTIPRLRHMCLCAGNHNIGLPMIIREIIFLQSELKEYSCQKDKIQIISHVLVSAYLDGPPEKEVEDEAGSDVELTCDVGGYPIKFEWLDEQDAVIGIVYLDLENVIGYTSNACYPKGLRYMVPDLLSTTLN